MIFPINHCVPTKYLTKESYSWLLTKLISQGYHHPTKLDDSRWFDMWKYIGCTSSGDIILFDSNKSYLDIDNEDDNVNNVLSEEFIKEYLK